VFVVPLSAITLFMAAILPFSLPNRCIAIVGGLDLSQYEGADDSKRAVKMQFDEV
jgi:hypothetical protein